mmetsp:Transcript_104012/g.335387  ORF Transcript_104012/g.335387 Transcript_104012/m.335387 type:complete len:282 (-) Transcript_104012:320-1165(-)
MAPAVPAVTSIARSRRGPRQGPRRAGLLCAGLALAVTALVTTGASTFVPAPGHALAARPQVSGAGALGAAAGAAGGALLAPLGAAAKGGLYGPLEAKASSLVHPIIMPLLFFVTLYTGFLGWQWRQTRLVGIEVADLRKQLPKSEDPETEPSAAVKAIKTQIEELTAQRSDLVKGQYKDRHYQISALLLGGGVLFTTYGVFNTWFRTEKLFPGPHLFAGVAVCVGWCLAAACVPWMEKGNEAARNLHIAINVLTLGLFLWQLPTGFEILQKVWGNANLPWF